MRMKILLLGALASAALGLIFVNSTVEKVSDYVSRDSLEQNASADGMQLIYSKLRGNLRTGKVEPGDWYELRAAVEDQNRAQSGERAQDLSWIEVGPDNVGGRTRALLVVDDNTVFAGSCSGGLWKSTDGANSWSIVESFPNCIIGSVAQTGNGDIYVGTGNQFEVGGTGSGGSGFVGAGLFHSADGGETWALVDGTAPSFMTQNANWNAINTLEGDPSISDRVWIGGDAGFGYYDGDSDNLVMNQQDGMSNTDCQDIDLSSDGAVMLVAMSSARIYRSLDGGNTFTQLSTETDLPNSSGRARVSVSDLDHNKCFVLYAKNNGNMGGVYYSGNAGDSWTNVWPEGVDEYDLTGSNNQGTYDLALNQNPFNPDIAYCGGVSLWKITSVGQPEQISVSFAFPGFDLYVHSDIHEFKTAPNGDLYIGTDGGVFKSTDQGETFFPANNGYNVTQFYGIGISSGLPVIGGAQDNGTVVILGDGTLVSDQSGLAVYGGDGFDCEISQATYGDNVVAFATSQNGHLGRFDNNGVGGPFYDEEIQALANPLSGDIGPFYTSIRLFEDTEDEDSQQLITIVNPTDTTIFGPYDLNAFTGNMHIPFTYNLPEGDTLQYWNELVRPAFTSTEWYTTDPNYWWLDVQVVADSLVDCLTDSVAVDTVSVIDQIIEQTVTLYWQDTIIVNNVPLIIYDSTIVVTGYDTTYIDQINYDYIEDCITYYNYTADTLQGVAEQIRITDPYSSLFSIGFNGSNGIWITRDALNLTTSANWWKVVNVAPSGMGVKAQEFSADGNNLFYSSWSGQVYRLSGLDSLWSVADLSLLEQTPILGQAGGPVTGIASDPNDVNHLVIAVGGYGTIFGNNGHVMETMNALDPNPTWTNLWFNSGDMSKMPCYDVIVDVSDVTGSTIVVGTEFGVYTTNTKGGSDGTQWTQQNGPADSNQTTGLDACPTFTLRQQQIKTDKMWRAPTNKGVIYAGTHGRGIFRSETLAFTSIDEWEDNTVENNLMLIYPNPASENVYLDVELSSGADINIYVYNLTGDLVKVIEKLRKGPGMQTISLEVSDLSPGTYVLQLNAAGKNSVGKFIVLD